VDATGPVAIRHDSLTRRMILDPQVVNRDSGKGSLS